MQVREPGGPSTIKGAFDKAFAQSAAAGTAPNFKQQGIKEKLSGLYYKARKLTFADVKSSFTTRFAKVKSLFTNLPETFANAKKAVTEAFTTLKSKVTVENIKGLKDKVVAGIKDTFTAEKFTSLKDKVVAGFKDIPKKAAELKGKISNKIFNEAIKQKFANINWKSVGIKGAIVAGALLLLYAGAKVVKSIFAKNNA